MSCQHECAKCHERLAAQSGTMGGCGGALLAVVVGLAWVAFMLIFAEIRRLDLANGLEPNPVIERLGRPRE